MVDDIVPSPEPGSEPRHEPKFDGGLWLRRLVFVLIVLVVGWLFYLFAAAFLPTWWANRAISWSHGSSFKAVVVGFAIGLVFSLVAALVVLQARRSMFNWPGKFVLAGVGVVIAIPLWLSLAVAKGGNESAILARKALANGAPGFGWAVAVGAVVGVLLAVGIVVLNVWLAHRRQQVRRLKADIKAHKRAEKERQAAAARAEKSAEKSASPDSEKLGRVGPDES